MLVKMTRLPFIQSFFHIHIKNLLLMIADWLIICLQTKKPMTIEHPKFELYAVMQTYIESILQKERKCCHADLSQQSTLDYI